MTPSSAALLTYAAQIVAVVLAATLASGIAALPYPRARLYFWRGILGLCIALPFMALQRTAALGATVTFAAATLTFSTEAEATTPIAATFLTWLPWIVAAGILVRIGWLLLGAAQLRQLRATSEPAAVQPEIEALRMALAPRAELRSTTKIAQPVTFGHRHPVVLLPDGFNQFDPDSQRAIVCHELAHVARHDWLWILGEEMVRAALWFNPAIWWVLAQINLNREQVVDEFVVARTGLRRAYMQMLLHFADARPSTAPALPFLRRRHVAARLNQLSKECAMSRARFAGTALLLAAIVTATTVAVVLMLPLNIANLSAQGAATSLELRLAETQPGAGLTPARVAVSGEPVFLQGLVLASQDDVVSARVIDGGRVFSIEVTFSSAAAARLSASTGSHLGRPLAVLLDGRVISAPTVRSAFGASALITGAFSRAEADAIAAALARGRGQASIQRSTGRALTAVKSDEPGVVLPTVVTSAKPAYTQAAMQAKITGDVLVSAVVDSDGLIREASVKRSLDTVYGLDQSAIESLRDWRFQPGTKNGMPVPVEVELLMTFRMR